MRHRTGPTLLTLGLLLAGCGAHPATSSVATRAATTTRAQATTGPVITAISGDGRVATSFMVMAGFGIELKALVSNPTNAPVTYHWDTTGGGWGDVTQPTFEFDTNWQGLYQATCTLEDAAGHALDHRSVSIDVWSNPTPPPIPNPPIPPHAG